MTEAAVPGAAGAARPPDGAQEAEPPDGAQEAGTPEVGVREFDGAQAAGTPEVGVREFDGAQAAGTPGVGVRELEALLFVAERPLARREIGTLCGIDPDRVDALLGDLEVALRDRGIRLAVLGDEVRLVTAPEAGGLIGRYTGAGETRVSPAALEALAIVAYRQPVTRGVVERVRGVDSDYVIRSLIARRLVVEQGRADTPGRPILYATSFEFLERFGLASLDDLPPLDAEVAARLVLPDDDSESSEGDAPESSDEDVPGPEMPA